MPVSPSGASSGAYRWGVIFALLVIIAVGVTWLVSVVPPSLSKFFGGCLIAAGALNILLHRRSGRQTFEMTRTMSPFIANFWERIGKEGAQVLYFGIGIVLALAGTFLLVKSTRA